MTKINRRSFLKKSLGLIGVAVVVALFLPKGLLKRKEKKTDLSSLLATHESFGFYEEISKKEMQALYPEKEASQYVTVSMVYSEKDGTWKEVTTYG